MSTAMEINDMANASAEFNDISADDGFSNLTSSSKIPNYHGQYGGENYDFNYDDVEYDYVLYPGYPFERPVYMYVWGILVLITFLANIMVIFVLLQKKMRNPTNMILAAIAISDSLTGLVTLPTYWVVYAKFNEQPPAYTYNDYKFDDNVTISESVDTNETSTSHAEHNGNGIDQAQVGYFMSPSLCRAFMISKFFLSKTFHAVSIWLTLFLGFQRFISVALPFRAKKLFCERNVIIICCVIAILAPALHIYHLFDEKADTNSGMCQWEIEEKCDGCVYLIAAFLLRHFLPCLLLVIFTALVIYHLARSSYRLRNNSNRGNAVMDRRIGENRRVSILVTIIVIVFLIPELPYGGFLMYALIAKLKNVPYNLETNRAIHLAYEVSYVLSYHAKFYTHTIFNKRFRTGLVTYILAPLRSRCGMSDRRCSGKSCGSQSTCSCSGIGSINRGSIP